MISLLLAAAACWTPAHHVAHLRVYDHGRQLVARRTINPDAGNAPVIDYTEPHRFLIVAEWTDGQVCNYIDRNLRLEVKYR